MTPPLLRWALNPVLVPRVLAWLLWLWAGFTIGLLAGMSARPVRADTWDEWPAAETVEALPVATPEPAPAPAPPASPTAAMSVPELIVHYARRWGAPGIAGRAKDVAWCESKYLNVPNGRGSGAKGVFQFMDGTFYANAPAAGFAGASPWDVEANVATALWLMAHNQWFHWRQCL